MIRAIMFDLDGTLVESETLKAQAYAIAVQRLLGLQEPDPRAVEAYQETVGVPRDVASRNMVERLGLEAELRPLKKQYGVSETSEVLTAMRTEIYDGMVADPRLVRGHQWPHTVGLLRTARESYWQTALATMSYRDEAMQVLRALDLEQALDLVLTREDVKQPKPDPEIYLLAARRLNVPPQDCLVLEDSPTGVRAGVAAGTNVIAVATPFTVSGLHTSGVLEHAWVVHDPANLLEVVRRRIAEHNRTAH